jgi:hypothetical protein
VSDELTGPGLQNQDPQVWLSSAPPEGTVSSYTIQMFWGGWDPDGEIAYYEYCITDNESGVFMPEDTTGADKWRKVFRNDSTFTFTADQLADSSSTDFKILQALEFIRSHTFFIRAVDELGLASRRPAYRSFTARTLSPVVDITVPTSRGSTPAEVPPISTFSWTGIDYVNNERETQPPDSSRWILVPTSEHNNSFLSALNYIRTTPDSLMTKEKGRWFPWVAYDAPGDLGKSWTTPPLVIGKGYSFAVQVKDEAGAISAVFDENRNVRRIQVSPRTTGPVLTLYNKYIGTIVTASPNTEPVIVDLPSNIPMCFSITADAKVYGGVVSGWRYGWDIQDLADPRQWTIDFTPFVRVDQTGKPTADIPCRSWRFDTHTIYIEVIDNSGYKSRVAVTLNIVPFSMRKNLFLVDDWKENSPGLEQTLGGQPSDEEHDAFWVDVLSDLDDFDPIRDVLQVEEEVPLTAFADYKALVWVAAAAYNGTTPSFINNVVRFVDPTRIQTTGKTFPNTIGLFMAAGGKVMLAGEQIMTASINRGSFAPNAPVFPLMFRYELSGDQDGSYQNSSVGVRGIGDESFAYQDCCLNVLDIAYINTQLMLRRWTSTTKHVCPVTRVRPAPQSAVNDGLRVAIPDSSLSRVFPPLSIRPESGADGRWFAPSRSGLNADIYNPAYFALVPKGATFTGTCNDYAELTPRRSCFEPIYLNGCLNTNSLIYRQPVAFWTTTYKDRVPDAGGVAARSVIMGFQPVYFNPAEFKQAMGIILFDEWQLPRKTN